MRSHQTASGRRTRSLLSQGLVLLVLGGIALTAVPPAWAVPMSNDPKGFRGIPWGASLGEIPELALASSVERTQTYDMKNGPPVLGEVQVESMHFIAIDGKFARVIVRYRGKQNHDQLLAYLQAEYGPVDRSPGMIMRGHSQQFNWRGVETEVTLSYDGARDRGHVFFDSRVLAPRFNEGYGDAVY
jgi:hypothetical protein